MLTSHKHEECVDLDLSLTLLAGQRSLSCFGSLSQLMN